MERTDRPTVAVFFAPERPVPGVPLVLGESVAHHARVRRLDVGARVRLLDGEGTTAEGVLVRLEKRRVTVEVERASAVDPPPPVHLLVPVGDRDRMLWLAEKAVELGVTSWRPVLWRRSRSVSPRGEGMTFQQKVRARMAAALEQCEGAWLPQLFPEATPERAIAAAPEGARIVLDADGEPMLARGVDAPLSIALGPEGGLERDERDALVEAGWVPASLGGHILRFETAGIAALAVARAAIAARGAAPRPTTTPEGAR